MIVSIDWVIIGNLVAFIGGIVMGVSLTRPSYDLYGRHRRY